MRSVFIRAGIAIGVVSALSNAVYAVSYLVDSVGILDPNPSNLTITLAAGNNLSLNDARTLVQAGHVSGTGGVIDFQQQFQGGTFPNATAGNNGIDVAGGVLNPLLVTTSSGPGTGGLVATGTPILSFYRLESTATGTAAGSVGTNNIDSNTNQGGNIVSGGYKSRNPGTGTNYDGSARDGNPIVGPIDFTGGIPTVDVGTVNGGGSYMGITGSASPATFVFNTPLSYFGITAVPRGATRDTTITLTLSDNSTVVLGNEVVGAAAVFFSYLAPTGLTIKQAAITNPNAAGQNRYDDLAFIVAPTPVAESTWNLATGGSYNVAANWNPASVPNAVGATANFGASITAPSTVDVASAVIVGKIRFANANAYTLSGSGSVALDATTGNAAVEVTLGTHVIASAVTLVDSLDVTPSAGTSLTISGPLTFSAGTTISAAGAGTTRISSAAVTGSATAVARSNGGTLELASDIGPNVDLRADAGLLRITATQHARSLSVTSQATVADSAGIQVVKVPTLTVAAGGVVDIGDNVLLVDYAGASPLATLTDLIRTGRGPTGTYTGLGIRSANAAATSGTAIGIGEASDIGSPATYRGEAIDGSTIIVTYTLAGDTDLNRTVNFNDLLAVAQNYGTTTGGLWTKGDFDYDGAINFNDLLALAQNYGGSLPGLSALQPFGATFIGDWTLALSLVPEPTSMLSLAAAALAFGRRRR